MVRRDPEQAGDMCASGPLHDDEASLERVLTGVTGLMTRVREGASINPLLLVGALTYVEAVQRCHEQKVETVLLPALASRDAGGAATAAAPVKREHEEVRHCLATLRRLLLGSRAMNEAVGRAADEAIALLRTHRAHEAQGLFALADRLITGGDVAPLWDELGRVDAHELPPGERRTLRALAAAVAPERRAANGHVDLAGVVAAHVMRPRPRVVRPTDSLARASELMDHAEVRELPVVDGGRLCGIIARSDLMPHLGHLEWTRVDAAMTSDPVVVAPEEPLSRVSRLLLRGRFNALPVLAGETLVGMVSRSDLLRPVAEYAETRER